MYVCDLSSPHLAGVCDKKMEEAFVASESHLALPSVGEWVVVLMTTVITPNRFFIQLPCGLHSPFTLGSSSSGSECIDAQMFGDAVQQPNTFPFMIISKCIIILRNIWENRPLAKNFG